MTLVFLLKVVKKGFSPTIGSGLARQGVILKSFEKESILMNLCKVNRKIPDLKRHPLPKVNKQHDQLTTANFEQRKGVFVLLSFCDESWGFRIKASYFFRAFSGKKMVAISQQECFWTSANRDIPND